MLRKKTLVLLTFSALLSALTIACAASGPKKSVRWVPYAGCSAGQCKSWYEECSAECVNQHDMSTTECEAKCRANVPNCESQCSSPG